MSSRNPNFRVQPDVNAIRHERTSETRLFAAVDQAVRQLETYLNRHVLRREQSSGPIYGDATTHNNTTWGNLTPAVRVVYPKAHASSILVVRLDINGFADDVTGTGRVDFGIRAVDSDNTETIPDTLVCGTGIDTANHYIGCSGTAELPVSPAGETTLRVRIRVDAATTVWTSSTRSTMSIAVLETHAP